MASACQKVFNTTELMDAILTFLPPSDVLRMQTVCRQWQQVIAGSSVLKKKLFFTPAKSDTVWLVDVTNLPSGTIPIHGGFRTRMRVEAAVAWNSDERKTHHGLLAIPVHYNPLCLRPPSPLYAATLDMQAHYGIPLEPCTDVDEWNLWRPASWKHMLLTQPPVCYVTVEFSAGNTLNMSESRPRNLCPSFVRKLVVEAGVRMGDIISAISKERQHGHDGFRYIRIHLHGAMIATAENEELVEARTTEWRTKLADAQD